MYESQFGKNFEESGDEMEVDAAKKVPKKIDSVGEMDKVLRRMQDRCIARNLRAAGLSGSIEDEDTIYGDLDANAILSTGESLLLGTITFVADDNRVSQYLSILLIDGADPNFRDEYMQTPLMHSIKLGKESAAKALLNHHSTDISAQDQDGYTALMYCAARGHAKILKTYLKAIRKHLKQFMKHSNANIYSSATFSDPLELKNKWGDTAAKLAYREGNAECVHLLDSERVQRSKQLARRLGEVSHGSRGTSPVVSARKKLHSVTNHFSFDSLLQVDDPRKSDEEALIESGITLNVDEEPLSTKHRQLYYQSQPALAAPARPESNTSGTSSSQSTGLSMISMRKSILSEHSEDRDDQLPRSQSGQGLKSKINKRRALYMQSKREMLKDITFTKGEMAPSERIDDIKQTRLIDCTQLDTNYRRRSSSGTEKISKDDPKPQPGANQTLSMRLRSMLRRGVGRNSSVPATPLVESTVDSSRIPPVPNVSPQSFGSRGVSDGALNTLSRDVDTLNIQRPQGTSALLNATEFINETRMHAQTPYQINPQPLQDL